MKQKWRVFSSLFILICSIASPARQGSTHVQREMDAGAAWSELEQAMVKMHTGMASIKPSGDNDADFIGLMLPHHQAALDMAKVELVYGKDPQIRRLAQEIVTDQQSEIELMELWLKRHEANSQK
ncbi:MAG TPA: DUF305 domain-containing protein [Terriglobales bacterium]|jgi:uncharacterized protein (DUF305 family)